MNHLAPAVMAKTIIPYFLRSLMRTERERSGLSKQGASKAAKWSPSNWGHLEREARPILPHHWINISMTLGLDVEQEVRRLNGFIGKYPRLWLQSSGNDGFTVFQKHLTSYNAVNPDNIYSVDLNQIRPSLFYELSTYSIDPEDTVKKATELDFMRSRPSPSSQPAPSPMASAQSGPARSSKQLSRKKLQRAEICNKVNSSISDDKLKILEQMLSELERFPKDKLSRAYKHFSLALEDTD